MAADIDLRKLRFFMCVVDHGGFSAAAKLLFTTQSTVSKAIKQLEQELGVTLLERGASRVALTDAGSFVRDHARKMLLDATDLRKGLDEIRGVQRGSLKIGVPRMGLSALFAQSYARFRDAHPAIDVEVTPFDVADLFEQIRTGGLDLGVVIEPVPTDLESRHVVSSSMVLLVPQSHFLASRSMAAWKELEGEPVVLFEEGTPLNDTIVAGLRSAGVPVRVAARTSQIYFAFELVAAGVGIAFAPEIIARTRRHPTVEVIGLESKNVALGIAYAWRRGGYLSHAARAWLALDAMAEND